MYVGTDWVALENKGRFTGEVYLEMTFYAEVRHLRSLFHLCPTRPNSKSTSGTRASKETKEAVFSVLCWSGEF